MPHCTHHGSTERYSYRIDEVIPYINWIYFFHTWGFSPIQIETDEAVHLQQDALQMLRSTEYKWSIEGLFRLCQANSEGDDLLISTEEEPSTLQHVAEVSCQTSASMLRFPLLRQQYTRHPGDAFLCLSDFIRPVSQGIPDYIGFFAASVRTATDNDPYRNLLLQTLADRIVEAAVEHMHYHVRRTSWGYAPNENLSIPQLLNEEFQGIRPAVGYPSLPDQSVNFLIDRLIDMKQIGISLTENGAMHPHASVSGLMLSHPAARYFSVGKIGPDQLASYANRRGLNMEKAKKFLAANL